MTPYQALDDFLSAVFAAEGRNRVAHEGGYSYWHDESRDGKLSSLCFGVDATWLMDVSGEAYLTPDGTCIEFDGERIAVKFDKTKIRRRVEDALRKTVSAADLLAVAVKLGVKLD